MIPDNWFSPFVQELITALDALGANAVNKQLCIAKNIPLRQFYNWNGYFGQAKRLGAAGTPEMNVFIVMFMFRAACSAKCKTGSTRIIQHFVQ